MKISYDQATDSLYIHLSDRASVDSDEVQDGVVLDYDANGALVGIDLQHASQRVDMPIAGTYVGMVDREDFDPWLRQRAVDAGAELRIGSFKSLTRLADGRVSVSYLDKSGEGGLVTVSARAVIGADGARSQVGRQCVPGADKIKSVFAYHEIVTAPAANDAAAGGGADDFDGARCDVSYQGRLSPDFYAWVFPHGDKVSIGTGSALRD